MSFDYCRQKCHIKGNFQFNAYSVGHLKARKSMKVGFRHVSTDIGTARIQHVHAMVSIMSPTIKIRNKHLCSLCGYDLKLVLNFRFYELCMDFENRLDYHLKNESISLLVNLNRKKKSRPVRTALSAAALLSSNQHY